MATLVRKALELEGYSVDVAMTGTDAVWMGTENEYDAIVLDVMIPEPDGFEVCRRLRADGRWAPILLLTARDSVDDRVVGLDAGRHTLDLLVDDAELARRRSDWKLPEPRYTSGVLAKYAKLAQGAEHGAITTA